MSGGKVSAEQRKARLAKALKSNLARRKAHAKLRKPAEEAPETTDEEDGCPN